MEEAQMRIENRGRDLEHFEVNGFPAYLIKEESYYSTVHVITNEYAFSINTHGIKEEQLLDIVHSIDMNGL
ncbi:DUF4367 domain-containing protein [Evansella halocellulosilytica]|uniref:DUF4367 domain-containing protein n=1 Tax=Evansella halocellulosilytica TaxID=2011013 RepID=UPI000BB76C3B|nr:DUF4367 domain-containing protein [Evansella halocellulosilytica]